MYNSKQLEHLRLLLQVRPTHRTVRENKSCSSPSLYLNYRWSSDNDNRINITLENERQSHKQSCLERTFGNLCTSIGIVHILLWLLIMTSKLNMLMIMKIYAWWVKSMSSQTILVASSLHMHRDWLQCLSFLSVWTINGSKGVNPGDNRPQTSHSL